MAYDIGPRIGIEGEAEFRKQINNITIAQRTLATEMQAVTSAYDKNDKSQENLTSQNQVLTKQIEAQKQKLDLLRDGLAAAAQKYGENDKVTQGWQQSVNKATVDLNKMERQLQENNDVLNKVDDATDDATGGMKDFENSVKDAGDESTRFADVLKANLLSQAIIDGVKKLADSAKDMVKTFIESAATVKAETAQFEQTFGTVGSEAEKAIGRVANASGILDTRLNGVATSVYAFARSSGADTTEAMSLMEEALQAAADGAAYYDRSLEDVSESLMSFLKGNFSNDAALGVSATEFTRNAKAAELFGMKYNDLSEIQKQQTLLKMVTDAQKLSGAMGQAAREADGWENVQGNLDETLRQFYAKVGTPLLENLVPVIQDITKSFQEWANSIDVEKLSEMVTSFFTFVKENAVGIIAGIAGIGAAFIGWNVGSIISAIIVSLKALIAPTVAADAATKGLNTTMKANPIGLVVAAIMVLVTALITLWTTNEDFRNGVIAIWENIKATIGGVVSALVDFFTKTIPDAWNNLGSFFTSEVPKIVQGIIGWFNQLPEKIGYAIGQVFSGILNFGTNFNNWVTVELPKFIAALLLFFIQLPDKIKAELKKALTNVVNWGKDLVRTAQTEIPKFVKFVVDEIGKLPGKMLDIGKNIVHGIWEGISGAAKWLGDQISGFVGGIVEGFKAGFDINSPSRVMAAEVGRFLPPGITVGMDKAMPAALQDVKEQISALMEQARIAIGTENSTFSAAVATAGASYRSVAPIPETPTIIETHININDREFAVATTPAIAKQLGFKGGK